MATTTMKQLGQAAAGITVSTVYTVPATSISIIKEMILCNTSATNASVTVYFVASGDTPAVKNTILSSSPLLAGETQIISFSTFLNAGMSVQIQCDVADVVGVTMSGVEMSQ